MYDHLIYENGLIVPSRESVKPITFHEAVMSIREASYVYIMEAANEDGGNWLERGKKFIRMIIEKVIAVLKKWIAWIKGDKKQKTNWVIKNRAAIIRFPIDNTTQVNLPEKILSPTSDISLTSVIAYIHKFQDEVSMNIISGSASTSKKTPNGVPTSAELSETLMRTILANASVALGDAERVDAILAYIYGEVKPIPLSSIDKQKLFSKFTELSDSIDYIERFKSDMNVSLTGLLTDYEKKMKEAPESNTAISYIANSIMAILDVSTTFLSVYSKVYYMLFGVLSYMIKANKGLKEAL